MLIVGVAAATVALLGYLTSIVSNLRVPRLRDQPDGTPSAWPRLSVVVPARDEGKTIRVALQSLLSQDYPELQIVLVDDRSGDDTGAIMDEVAASDDRVRVVHVEHRNAGWLGKVHAMQAGTEHASGALVLYCDADVHMEPGLLRRAVSVLERERLDHLTLFPRLLAREIWQHAFGCTFAAGYIQRTLGSGRIEQPTARHFGYGAFNLVRRSVLDASLGLEWIRLDVLDDLALVRLIKEAGGRVGFMVATSGLAVEWYPTLRQTLASLDKNFFGGMARYQLGRAVLLAAAPYFVVLGPFLLLAQDRWPLAWLALPALAAALLLDATVGAARLQRPFFPALLTPVVQLILAAAVLRAAVRTRRAGGIRWREDFYSIEELRAGQRVHYP